MTARAPRIGLWALAALLCSSACERAEWRKVQRRYNEERAGRGLAPVPVRLRAIRVVGRGDEHCVTCHLGMQLEPAADPLFGAHPATGCTQSVRQLGCTACHRGNGRGLTETAAHGRGPRGLLDPVGTTAEQRRRLVAVGCAQCHLRRDGGLLRYDEQVVPEVAAGLGVFLRQGCPSCHRLAGVFTARDVGPGLSDVGWRVDRDRIDRTLREPRWRAADSPMPPQHLVRREHEQLMRLLVAQVGPERELGTSARDAALSHGRPPRLAQHFPDAPLPTRAVAAVGAWWARRVGCSGCHRLGEDQRGVPDLRFVGWTTGKQALRQILAEPQRRVPSTRMPALAAPDVIVESVQQYLSLQRVPLPSTTEALFETICQRCHGAQRDTRAVVLAKKPPLIARGSVSVARDVFVTTVTKGRQGTAMAAWGLVLSKAFIGSLYDQLAAR